MVIRSFCFVVMAALAPIAVAVPVTSAVVAKQAQAALEHATSSDGPGAVILIARGDEIIYRAARGSAQIELGVPLQADQTFRIASITKMFTAALVVKLAQLGQLSLDDKLATYVPGIANGETITLRQLLNHTAGVSDIVHDPQPGFFARKVDTATLIAEIKKREPSFPPGTRFAYSNAGYILLGAVIEKVTGRPWQDALRTTLLEPLDLKETAYGDNARIVPRRVAGYTTDNANRHVENASYINASVPAAAGALVSTANDLLHWMRALAQGKVVGRDGFKQMTTAVANVPGASTHPYGFGMYIWQVRGNEMVGHTGQIDGFASALAYLPQQDITVVVLANDDNFDARTMARRMAAIALGQPYADPVPAKLTEDQLRAFEGVYRIDDATTETLSIKDGQLYGQRSNRHAVPLMLTVNQRLYFVPDELSYFTPVRDASGKVVRLDYFEGGDDPALPMLRVASDTMPL
ncbi:serine hydrolase domain-containing protein [Dyella sp. GSA-30]|uniref:serine hydrolase domain-containing protein n=1 Tax=Dyella sp. GSA-30 TaxID=2994496 RepID=UPI00248F9C24|nr:serine hydrolase domain-containing protein [Dyella sp. GSA-30]